MSASLSGSRAAARRLAVATLAVAVLAFTPNAPALAGSCRAAIENRPSIGLALGGGGARGSAHIGVIRRLEELRIPVDVIAGTSMGSLVGAMYATGMSADQLEQVVLGIDWDELFEDSTDRRDRPFRRKRDDDLALYGPKLGIGEGSNLLSQGAISGQKISFLFETLVRERTTERDFAALPIPYRAIATGLASGEEVVMKEGDLALAMRASMSVPGVFDPVRWQGQLVVDGGMVNNLPLDQVRDMGADVVIAVDVGTGLAAEDDLKDMVSILGQLTAFLTTRNVEANLATLSESDVLIQPPLGDKVSSASFNESATGIDIGYRAAVDVSEQLAGFAVSEQEYREYRDRKQACLRPATTVQFVKLDNQSRFDDSVIMERVDVQAGEALDYQSLEKTVSDIYALGFLELARYEVLEENDETGVVIHVDQDSRGTQFLETGLDFSGDGDSSSIQLRLAYLNTSLDSFGSELRLLGQVGENPAAMLDIYKYFDPRLKLFAQPILFAERREITTYDDGDALVQAQINQYGGILGIGREFSRYAAVSGGVRLFTGDVDVEIGPPSIPDSDFDGGEYFLRGTFDRMDDRYFPGDGAVVQMSYFNSDEALGADAEYEQVVVDAMMARSYARHSFLLGTRYYETIDGEAPPYALFRAGGFTRLSGYTTEELSGQNFGMLLSGYRYHVAGSGMLPAFVGATLEYGGVEDEANRIFDEATVNGSLYFGYRSPLGPLYIGVGAAEGGKHSYFFHIGNPFSGSSIAR